MRKYVFPPKFETEAPLFFAFEFDYTIKRDDLVKLYQNVMFDPDSSFGGTAGGSRFEQIKDACETQSSQISSCCIEDEKLINQIYGCIDELKWLVFKVKKRAKRDYDLLRRGGIDSPSMIARRRENRGSAPTYNWPYDYFSLVELIKIDATAQYSSVGFEALQTQQGPQETSNAALYRQGGMMTRVTGEAATEPALSEKTGQEAKAMTAGTALALLTGQGGAASPGAKAAANLAAQQAARSALDLLS